MREEGMLNHPAAAMGHGPKLGRRTAPDNATITITRTDSDIHVTVTATPNRNAPLLAALPATPITAEATVQSEPSQGELP